MEAHRLEFSADQELPEKVGRSILKNQTKMFSDGAMFDRKKIYLAKRYFAKTIYFVKKILDFVRICAPGKKITEQKKQH